MVQLDVLVWTTATRASLTSETESAALTEATTVSSETLCMDYIMDLDAHICSQAQQLRRQRQGWDWALPGWHWKTMSQERKADLQRQHTVVKKHHTDIRKHGTPRDASLVMWPCLTSIIWNYGLLIVAYCFTSWDHSENQVRQIKTPSKPCQYELNFAKH